MDEDGSEPSGRAGEQAAFTALVRRHQTAVFGFILRRTGERARAEDLAQEAFLRAWRGWGSFRGDASERTWLLRIAINLVRDDARTRSRRPVETGEPEHLDLGGEAGDPALAVEAGEAADRLADALAGLPANHREIFLLRERDGLAYKEIAEVLGVPIGSVMSGLARARAKLLRAVTE